MFNLKSLAFGALAAALAVSAHAIDVAPDANGGWTQFKVDELESLSYGVEWIDNNCSCCGHSLRSQEDSGHSTGTV